MASITLTYQAPNLSNAPACWNGATIENGIYGRIPAGSTLNSMFASIDLEVEGISSTSSSREWSAKRCGFNNTIATITKPSEPATGEKTHFFSLNILITNFTVSEYNDLIIDSIYFEGGYNGNGTTKIMYMNLVINYTEPIPEGGYGPDDPDIGKHPSKTVNLLADKTSIKAGDSVNFSTSNSSVSILQVKGANQEWSSPSNFIFNNAGNFTMQGAYKISGSNGWFLVDRTVTISVSNPASITINAVNATPKYLLKTRDTRVQINVEINTNNVDLNNLTYELLKNDTLIYSTSKVPIEVDLKYENNAIYKVRASGGGVTATSTGFSFSREYDLIPKMEAVILKQDTIQGTDPLVYQIDSLKASFYYEDNSTQTFQPDSWSYKITDITNNIESATEKPFLKENKPFKLDEYETNIPNNKKYQVLATLTETRHGISQTATAKTTVFIYPNKSTFNESNISFFNSNYNLTKNETLPEDFNDYGFLTLTYPKNGIDNYSKIDTVNIKANILPNNTLTNLLSVDTSSIITSETSKEYKISLFENLKEEDRFNLSIDLIDRTGQTTSLTSKAIYNIIRKPTFGETVIGSDKPQIIAINAISKDWIWNLAFSGGFAYTGTTTYPETDEGQKNKILKTIKQLDFILQTESPITKTYAFTTNNLQYSTTDSTARLAIPAAELQSLLDEYRKQNTVIDTTLRLTIADAFDNTATLEIIRFPNATKDNKVSFSFGVKPILPDYSPSSYTLRPKYNYSSDVYGTFYTNKIDTNNATKNMINFGDKLSFTFPRATDENGNDNGTNHGDIVGYRVKIFRTDSILSAQANEDDFTLLSEIPFTNNELIYDSINEKYTYLYNVNNYNISKFIRLAICAYDTTGLESNLIVYPYVIVAGRIQPASLAITSHKIETTEDGAIYDFKVNITDIGGNLFNDSTYNYVGYPNLERNITGNEKDSRDVNFFIQYRKENGAFIQSARIPFRLEKDGILYDTYDSNITYSALMTKTIRFEGQSFPLDLINPQEKAYFKIVAQIQTGFDNNGNKVYTTAESPVYVIYPSTPTVAYRKNSVGINTENLANYLFRIAYAGGQNQYIRIDSAQVGTDPLAPYILINVNDIIPSITGIEISDED